MNVDFYYSRNNLQETDLFFQKLTTVESVIGVK